MQRPASSISRTGSTFTNASGGRVRGSGTLVPEERHSAYPGITHGGILLTALGCRIYRPR